MKNLIAFYESPIGQKVVRLWGDDDGAIKRVIAGATATHAEELAEGLGQDA